MSVEITHSREYVVETLRERRSLAIARATQIEDHYAAGGHNYRRAPKWHREAALIEAYDEALGLIENMEDPS